MVPGLHDPPSVFRTPRLGYRSWRCRSLHEKRVFSPSEKRHLQSDALGYGKPHVASGRGPRHRHDHLYRRRSHLVSARRRPSPGKEQCRIPSRLCGPRLAAHGPAGRGPHACCDHCPPRQMGLHRECRRHLPRICPLGRLPLQGPRLHRRHRQSGLHLERGLV